MGKDLKSIARQLKDSDKKTQLIYAFNGTGKTRLSREFKDLATLKAKEDQDFTHSKILYYNAFTEDLFYWDNDFSQGIEPKLKIQPNAFIEWVVRTQGLEGAIVKNFRRFTSSGASPAFDIANNSVSFQVPEMIANVTSINGKKVAGGDGAPATLSIMESVKISKGEESNFIWSIFYTLLEQVITIRNEPKEEDEEGAEGDFDNLEYIFIDDPVSSLDENHLIASAVGLAALIKDASSDLRFIIATHSPLFYNVLHNELGLSKVGKKEGCYLLEKFEDGTYDLNVKYGDSNRSFSYHLHLRQIIERAIADNQIEKYHFTLLRNLYEKTASFLGYKNWSELLPEDQELYASRVMNFYSHKKLSSEEPKEPTMSEKQTVKLLLDHLVDNYGFSKEKESTI